MSLLSRIPSVNDTYFQHKLLTKIHGAPSYDSLQNLLIELKANAGSVPTTLGGGHHGHLGLIVSPERYATLAHTIPWVNPVNPGAFTPPAAGTAAQIEAARDVWKDATATFNICQATEKALVAQVVESIDPSTFAPFAIAPPASTLQLSAPSCSTSSLCRHKIRMLFQPTYVRFPLDIRMRGFSTDPRSFLGSTLPFTSFSKLAHNSKNISISKRFVCVNLFTRSLLAECSISNSAGSFWSTSLDLLSTFINEALNNELQQRSE